MNELSVIREQLQQYEASLLSIREELAARRSGAVPGSLHVNKTGARTQYYHRWRSGDTAPFRCEKYLSMSKDASLILRLAQQDYDRDLAAAVDKMLKKTRTALKALSSDLLSDVYTRQHVVKKDLITPLIPDRERFIADWDRKTWAPKAFSEDMPEFYSHRNERVRSKSEMIIADHYHFLQLHYRYECPVVLLHNGAPVTLHPDFTLLNTRTLQEIYHEHLGMMDDPGYVNDFLWRLNLYQENNIYQGKNLFFTYETKDRPFNTRQLDQVLRQYLS